MPGRMRIRTLQLQARELGRLRTGTFEKPQGKKGRPVRSDTWIVTSASQDYVTAAAQAWGGTPERWKPQGNGAEQWRVITGTATIDAILPPGDQLSQAFELWSRGGCQRRCDGEVETLSGQPCICTREFGEDFGANDDIPEGAACKPTTRLSVFLPDLPDLGVFRVETKSYYAAMELVGTVDTVRGLVGADAMVPIRLRIEPRTRVAQGKTKQYQVVVVELRGATAGQILGGDTAGMVVLDPSRRHARALTGAGQERRQIEAGNGNGNDAPAAVPGGGDAGPDWRARAMATESLDQVRALWQEAKAAGVLDADPQLAAFLKSRGDEFAAAESPGEAAGEGAEPGPSSRDGAVPSPSSPGDTPTDDGDVVDAEVVDGEVVDEQPEKRGERARLWQQILGADPLKTTAEARDAWLEFSGGEPFDTAPIGTCRAYAERVMSE